jgi:hypothetical protein
MSDPISGVSAVSATERRSPATPSWHSDRAASAAAQGNGAGETRSQKAAREQAENDAAASRRNPTPIGRMLDVVA